MALIGADDVPPLLPDAETARGWAEQELSDPSYAAAEPTGFDRFARDLAREVGRFFDGTPTQGWGQVAAVVLLVVLAAVIVAAFVIWGRPRMTARSRVAPGDLFGGTAVRSAADHRRDAEAAAARGDWDTATLERVRAIARALAERVIVDTPPGATVQTFAVAAAAAFPARADALRSAARSFDDVRYLRRHGDAETYRAVERLDTALEGERPARDGALV